MKVQGRDANGKFTGKFYHVADMDTFLVTLVGLFVVAWFIDLIF